MDIDREQKLQEEYRRAGKTETGTKGSYESGGPYELQAGHQGRAEIQKAESRDYYRISVGPYQFA